MKKVLTIIYLSLISGSCLASLILAQHQVILKFDRDKYTISQPNSFSTQGILLLLKDKETGTHNFSFSSGGFVSTVKAFEEKCNEIHQTYKEMGGEIGKLSVDLKAHFPKCRFRRSSTASLDMVEMTYSPKKKRAFIFNGLLLKMKKQSSEKYIDEFNQLAKGIAYEY